MCRTERVAELLPSPGVVAWPQQPGGCVRKAGTE